MDWTSALGPPSTTSVDQSGLNTNKSQNHSFCVLQIFFICYGTSQRLISNRSRPSFFLLSVWRKVLHSRNPGCQYIGLILTQPAHFPQLTINGQKGHMSLSAKIRALITSTPTKNSRYHCSLFPWKLQERRKECLSKTIPILKNMWNHEHFQRSRDHFGWWYT